MEQRKLFTPEAVAAMLSSGYDQKGAEIANLISQKPFSVQTLRIDLTTAGTFNARDVRRVGFAFKSFWVNDASDVNVTVDMKVNSLDETQSSFPIRKNDAAVSSSFFSDAFFAWEAQSGKFMELTIFTDAEYRSGSQISVTGGGVTLNDGSTVTGPTRVTLSATTATVIAPADGTRKLATLQNKTGADLYIGGSTIGAVGGANEGIKIPSDGIFYFRNTGALYGWSVAGGNVHRVEET